MNANVTQALLRDATAQVIDNKIFRILLVLLGVLLLPVLLVAAREHELVICFFWHFKYEELASLFGSGLPHVDHPNQQLIQGAETVLTDYLGGGMGTLFGITATAFFMPRMLEKGAADVVFSKPVSRFALLISRYVAGLIFASILAVLLIGGMHLGFLLNSGYSDPGFLWSIPILIYVFGVVHAVSLFVGVMTRSSVAAILVTLVFYSFNSCVHNAWSIYDTSQSAAAVVSDAVEEKAPEVHDEAHGMLKWMTTALDIAHYVLPKTTDATIIARSVRRAIHLHKPEFADDTTGLFVLEPPEGYTRDPASSIDSSGIRWRVADPNGSELASIVLQRRALKKDETRMQAARLRSAELEQRGPAIADLTTRSQKVLRHWFSSLEWNETEAQVVHRRRALFVQEGTTLYTLDFDATASFADAPEHQNTSDDFMRQFRFGEEEESSDGVYVSSGSNTALWSSSRYGWTAPWRYNFFLSIGSTLAFIALMLARAQHKLSRIDF